MVCTTQNKFLTRFWGLSKHNFDRPTWQQRGVILRLPRDHLHLLLLLHHHLHHLHLFLLLFSHDLRWKPRKDLFACQIKVFSEYGHLRRTTVSLKDLLSPELSFPMRNLTHNSADFYVFQSHILGLIFFPEILSLVLRVWCGILTTTTTTT